MMKATEINYVIKYSLLQNVHLIIWLKLC